MLRTGAPGNECHSKSDLVFWVQKNPLQQEENSPLEL
jgi:hypothetical protein